MYFREYEDKFLKMVNEKSLSSIFLSDLGLLLNPDCNDADETMVQYALIGSIFDRYNEEDIINSITYCQQNAEHLTDCEGSH